MQFSDSLGAHAPRAESPLAFDAAHADPRSRAWPTLCGLVVAMICFGAARIHASGALPTADRIAEPAASVTTRLVAFEPQAFAPAAFADWADQDKPSAQSAEFTRP